MDEQCGSTLLIRVKPLSGMVRMVEGVLVVLQASSESSNSALGNGTELQHRRRLTLSRLSAVESHVAHE